MRGNYLRIGCNKSTNGISAFFFNPVEDPVIKEALKVSCINSYMKNPSWVLAVVFIRLLSTWIRVLIAEYVQNIEDSINFP